MRIFLYTVWFLLFAGAFVNAQSSGSAPPETSFFTIETIKWAFTQGGLAIVTLAIGWSYRRDFLRVVAAKDAQLEVVTGLVESNTEAMVALKETLRNLACAK